MFENRKLGRGHFALLQAWIGCVCLFSSLPAAANTAGTETIVSADSVFTAERERFIEARAALALGNRERFNDLAAGLEHYPLQHYLESELLKSQWSSVKPGSAEIDALNSFEQKTGDASLTRRLTRNLQKRFADTKQWRTFLGISKSRLSAKMSCTTLKALDETGKLQGFTEEALELWVQPKKHPDLCASVLQRIEAAYTPPVIAIWEKIFQAMDARKPEFAKPVLGYLASKDRALVKRWIASRKKPESFLTSGDLSEDTVLNRRIVANLIVEWSRLDTPAAVAHWLKIKDSYGFYRDRKYDTHRAIIMRGAYRRLPQAQAWLMGIEARDDDLELMEWRVRTALLAQDWKAVLGTFSLLPEQEQKEDHWAYWQARALEQLGQPEQAAKIYNELAELQSYYGFLAADRLSLDYSIYDEPITPDADLLARLAREPALIKAREFHFVELQHESRREWNNWSSGRSVEELAAAAVLANHWMLHDRAIFNAGQAEQKRAITLRFPVLYRTDVAQAASENRIDPAWIFGVMRRESAYIRDIRSGAGAIGLMQLMPRTASYVAGLQGQKNWKGDLTDAQTNIGFGTFYLRHVMDKFDDHQVLATASYNAGPHRVDKWLLPESMDADVWIDTIPFTETRRYVRAVLAYTSIYEAHLSGKPQRLSSKLKPVPAASGV
ncbi:MAG: transglycosylase SLT domain-containing protein [Granulosicoccus sp.]